MRRVDQSMPQPTTTDSDGSISLFDGVTLDGWYAVARTYGRMWPGGPTVSEINPDLSADYAANAAAHPAVWSVANGAIEGRQDPAQPGYGGYLVPEQTFGDFELELEMNPDWPADHQSRGGSARGSAPRGSAATPVAHRTGRLCFRCENACP
jgi:Domain of Unknown Function (DUF1080)